MNICFLSLDYPFPQGGGGVGTQVRDISRVLVDHGHRVSVVTLIEKNSPPFFEDEGIKVYAVPKGNLHWYLTKIPFLGSQLALPLRELEYSFSAYRLVKKLHAQDPFDLIEATETGALGVALGMQYVPLVIRLHGEIFTFYQHTPGMKLNLGIRLSRYFQRMALKKARLLISPSQGHADVIAKELGSLHPPIEVIPNSIDLKRLSNNLKNHRDDATVFFAGRLERRKGILLLLEAAERVIQKFPKVHFVIAGSFHPSLPEQEIHHLLERSAVNGHVTLLGHIPLKEVAEQYARATLCVIPSYYETFGITALEAMAHAVPLVATRVPGLVEVVKEGVTGILVTPGDVEALADAIVRLLEDPNLRQEMGEAGREYVKERFDTEKLLGRNLEAYQKVIGDKEE